MSRLKERDEQEALKLDESFKETLERVRPYILALNVPEESHLCRVWLQKLSCASSQRSIRNQYLLELCTHLKSGHVGGIFVKPPQNGPLEPLSRFSNRMTNASSSLSELSDTSCHVPQDPPRSMMKHRNQIFAVNRDTDSSSTNCDYEVADSPAVRYCDKARSDRNQLSIYKRRIESLTALVHDLQVEKERLKRSLSFAKENCECRKNSNGFTSTIDQLTLEITSLKAKLVEVNNMKRDLEKNHRDIVEQYKNAMSKDLNDLNSRLQEARSRNDELDEKVASINNQLENKTREKEEEFIAVEKNFEERVECARLHWETRLAEKDKELSLRDEIINEKDAELATREKFYKDEISLLHEKIHVLEDRLETKIEDEGKLQSFLKEQCSTMKEEFMKMRNDMEISARTENQSLMDKISALKKIILKLVKSKEKQGIEFESKISHVLKTKDFEIKNLELQLQEHQNELSATLSTEKQCELDSLVKPLEERYKALLAETDASVGTQRQNFLKKITFLENQITCMKNNLVDGDLYV